MHIRRPALQSGGRAGGSHLSGEGEKGADLIVIQEQMWTTDWRMREILNLSAVPETGALSGTFLEPVSQIDFQDLNK